MSDTNGLSKGDLLNINSALLALESPVPSIVDGKENRQPYDIGEKGTYAVIRNLRKLKSAVEDITAAREALAVVYNPNKLKASEVPEDKMKAWEAAHVALLKEPAEPIKFHAVDLSEFNVTKNKTMPRSIIATLLDTVIVDNATQDGVPKE